jgi:outer membrane protein assembly factor BamB
MKAILWTGSVGLVVALASSVCAGDWPQYGGPDRNGVSKDEVKVGWAAGGGPKVLWQAEVGIGYSSLAVVGDCVYTMGAEAGSGRKIGPSAVVCLKADTGKVLWRQPLGGEEPAGTPAVDDKAVYAVARDGTVGALNVADGKVLWQAHLAKDHGVAFGGWKMAVSPLLWEKGTVVLDVGKVLALDRATGKQVWSAGGGKAGYSSAVPFTLDGKTYMTTFNGKGLGVAEVAGKEVASTEWKTSWDVNAALPLIDGKMIFIASGYGRGAGLFEFNGSGLKPVYDKKVMRSQCNGPVLIGGHVYGPDGQAGSSGALQCVEMKSGEVKWSQPMKPGALVAAGGKLIVQADGGELTIVEASPAAYKELGKAKVLSGKCWTAPAVAGGRIYCRSYDGKVVCLDPSQAGGGAEAAGKP